MYYMYIYVHVIHISLYKCKKLHLYRGICIPCPYHTDIEMYVYVYVIHIPLYMYNFVYVYVILRCM